MPSKSHFKYHPLFNYTVLADSFSILLNNSSAKKAGGKAEPRMLRVRSLITPRNSGVQNIVPELYDAMTEAENMEPRLRPFMVAKVESRELGLCSISSEGGDMLKMGQTQRNVHTMEQINRGPPASKMDRWMYKEKLQHNPSGEYDKLI